MRRRIFWLLLISGALILGAAACSNQDDTPADSSGQPAAVASPTDEANPMGSADPSGSGTPSASDTPSGTVAAEASTNPEDSAGPGDSMGETDAAEGAGLAEADLPPAVEPLIPVETSPAPPQDLDTVFRGTSAALDALDSYRYVTTFSYSGVEDGEAEEGAIELTGAVSPGRQYIRWIDREEGESMELIRIDDTAWMRDEEGWEEIPAMIADTMSQAVLIFAPALSWEGLSAGLPSSSSFVGHETIHGIPTSHYTSSYSGWGKQFDTELVDTQGDVWIADEGYPMKYTFTASGVDEDGEPGTMTWTMELSDVNEEIIIEPPEITED